jgi:ABC-type tungstate transport system permease subunit
MKKQLLNNKFYIMADDSEIISIKDIKECIKSFEVLGIENVKIKGVIDIDFDRHNKQISEENANKLYRSIRSNEYQNIEIINNNKVIYGDNSKFEIKVNKDASYDYNKQHHNYYLSPIKRIELTW